MSTEEKKEKEGVDHLIDELFDQVIALMDIKFLKQMALEKIQEAETLEDLTDATAHAAYTFIKKKKLTEKAAAETEKAPEA